MEGISGFDANTGSGWKLLPWLLWPGTIRQWLVLEFVQVNVVGRVTCMAAIPDAGNERNKAVVSR